MPESSYKSVWVTTHYNSVLAVHSSQESAEKFLLRIVRSKSYANTPLDLNAVNQSSVQLVD